MDVIGELFGVAGKSVLITGGSRGIGEAIARAFVKAGATVYVCSRNAADCDAIAAALSRDGVCVSLSANIATQEGRDALVGRLADLTPTLDVLINNAGAIWAAPLADYPEAGWDKVFDLNVKGLFFLIRDLVPLLEKAGRPGEPARIINVGSIDGFHVPKHETYAYSSSKAAAHHLARHLAHQLAPRNVTVNVIAPGMFPSKMLKGTLETKGEAELLETVPLKRLTNDDDMAGAAIYLASRAASYVTGVVLPVDGGTATTL